VFLDRIGQNVEDFLPFRGLLKVKIIEIGTFYPLNHWEKFK